MTGPPRQPFWHGPPPSQPQGAPPGSNFHRFPPPSNPSVQVRNREHLISVTVKDDNGMQMCFLLCVVILKFKLECV